MSEWISVKDRLPERWTEVLVWPRPTEYCCEAHLAMNEKWEYGEYEHHFGHVHRPCKVTHWMPMPEPPPPPSPLDSHQEQK